MPTGRVKFYDEAKGFGFVSSDEGGDVFVPKSALPGGVATLEGGERVEFGVVEGKRGAQVLSLRRLEPMHSVAAAKRRPPEQLHSMIEDMVKVLEGGVLVDLADGRYPDRTRSRKVADLVRAVAKELDA